MQPKLESPFPWFGGKSAIAHIVWERFGNIQNYVEPFFGSGAVFFARPDGFEGREIVNDKDGLLCNFWRAIKHDPETTAKWADWPIVENDLHARHAWLVNQKKKLVEKLEGDPDFYDPKIAGWWVWGICSWIGGSWCSGIGPWKQIGEKLVKLDDKTLPGVNRRRPLIGKVGIFRKTHLSQFDYIMKLFQSLSNRLKNVIITCCDWSSVVSYTATLNYPGITGVFLDPPYSIEANRNNNLYAEENLTVAHEVRKWAIENGDNPRMRIALCGYESEHRMPNNWECYAWKAKGGYANQSNNRGKNNSFRERIWFSPHCLKAKQLDFPIECNISF